jgi:hypothetical protein
LIVARERSASKKKRLYNWAALARAPSKSNISPEPIVLQCFIEIILWGVEGGKQKQDDGGIFNGG